MRLRFYLLVLFASLNIGCSQNVEKEEMDKNSKPYSKESILEDLDDAEQRNPYKSFVHIENGIEYPIANRLLLFADKNRWSLVFEEIE